jgi:hypothetical protein
LAHDRGVTLGQSIFFPALYQRSPIRVRIPFPDYPDLYSALKKPRVFSRNRHWHVACMYRYQHTMSASPAHPVLRLITDDVARPQRPSTMRNAPRPNTLRLDTDTPLTISHEQVRAENVSAASSISALDPRWILAVQTSREIQGGRAAVITPESRRRLLLTGARLGLRPFDSNLVIAVVQDGARSGEDSLGRDVVARLRLVHPEPALADARTGPTWSQLMALVVVVATLSATLTALTILWFSRSG